MKYLNKIDATNGVEGNASTSSKLQTARTISGVSFDGSANIVIPYSGLSGTPMSLPANGGNADTLDGIHGSDYVIRVPQQYVSIDINTITTGGYYAIKGNCLNIPSAVDGYLEILPWNDGKWCAQIFIADRTGEMWFRTTSNISSNPVTFTSWRKIWNSANGGSGSGLDADTLDGYHASSFLQNTGGKITGNIGLDASKYIYFGYEEGFGGSDTGGADYGYITFDNDNDTYAIDGSSGENSCLRIGTQNDGTGSCSDSMALEPTADLFLNPSSGGVYVGNASNRKTVWHSGNFNPQGIGDSALGSNHAISDCNSATTTGFYYCSGTSNSPAGDGNLIVMAHSSKWIQQIFFEYNDKTQGREFRRNMYAGTWQLWYQIWDSANDGSGSGLDSDTIDGMQPATTNTANTIVQRDSGGNFSAGTITASLNGNSNTATKLQTARTIALSGGVIGTATSFDGISNISIPITSIDPAYLSGGYTPSNRMYINTHPENGGAILPFINNDLAFLTKKGGSMSAYKTTDTDYTKQSLTNSGTISIDDIAPFDGSPSYAGFSISATTDNIVIDITCHTGFAWGTNFYIDFGSTAWMAKDIYMYTYNNDSANSESAYKLMGSRTNGTTGEFVCYNSYSYVNTSSTSIQGFNKFRIILTNFVCKSPRIAGIGLINYGSSGLKETFISRGGSSVYGDIYPHTDSSYSLGTSSNYWSNIYTDLITVSSNTKVNNLNADLLDSYHADTNASANTVVARDGSGYIRCTYINSNRACENSSAESYLYDNGDGWMRKKTIANVRAELGGSGSGLIADTVDGVHASQINYGANGCGTTNLSSFNNLNKSGFYDGSSAIGSPETTWCHLINSSHYNSGTGNEYGLQLSSPFWSQTLYFRTFCPDNKTPSWNKIWHNSNDGSGSGLDSDLLDGQEGSYYLNYNNLINRPTLPTSLPANGGNSDTVDGLHSNAFCRAYSASQQFGGNSNGIPTSSFITMLTNFGAFNQPYWVARGSWEYAGNQYINDTGCGNIHLSGATIEVIGNSTNYTIRIHTPTTDSGVGVTNSEFIYVNNGSDYAPAWRKIWNSSNDGSDSGLDADKLDGLEGSYYLNYNNLTNKPSSIPANGGNADTLDGIDSTGFMKNGLYSGSVDLNNITSSGSYRLQTGITNKPSNANDYGILTVSRGISGDTIMQLYANYDSSTVWVRTGSGIGNPSPNWHGWVNLCDKLSTSGGYVNGKLIVTGHCAEDLSLGSGSPALEIQGSYPENGAAFMTFHRPNAFAANFGLDKNNNFSVGGWSMGNASYPIYHQGNVLRQTTAPTSLADGQICFVYE